MANPSTGTFSLTGDNYINSLTNGYRWNLDASRTVDFSVSGGLNGEYWYNPTLVSQSLTTALQTFSYYADIKFSFSGVFSNPIQAAIAGSEINLALSANRAIFPSSSVWAIGLFPGEPYDSLVYQGSAGDIYLNINSQANYLPSYAPGSAGWALLLHELGHTLGLKHPHDDGGTGRPTFTQLGAGALNLDVFTVMSYDDAAQWNLVSWDPATPMILDVLALQALYGKNLNTNAGNTTHYLTNNGSYSTIWDASGADTINVSGGTEGWVIDLPSTAWVSIVDTKVGEAVPVSQFTSKSPTTYKWLAGDFENVVGSRFNDRINGNQFSNTITGGGGDDLIDGGTGVDTMVYSGPLSRYKGTVGAQTVISDTQSNGDGTDTLTNIERLQFTDINVALDIGKDQTAGSGYMLYKAAFNRTPDVGGLGYWISKMDGGMSYSDVSKNFVTSAEFKTAFGGSNPSVNTLVTKLYNNVLNRTPDAGGLAFWQEKLNTGWSTADVLGYFSTSGENVTNVTPLIANGISYTQFVG